jgi:EAL domain-containing protein (putative c-di-GMP-specific phosphodiesterase class I)/GGDEF domain-containing protein
MAAMWRCRPAVASLTGPESGIFYGISGHGQEIVKAWRLLFPLQQFPWRRARAVTPGGAVPKQAFTGQSMESVAQSEAGVSGYLESLRRDRDRFVALAFCAADLLFEVDGERMVTFAAGATKSLIGREPEQLVGKPFLDLIAPSDRMLMGELIHGLTPGNRLDPVPVRLAGVSGTTSPLAVTGYHLPDLAGCYFFAMRFGSRGISPEQMRDVEQDSETGLLQADSFAKIATEQIREAESHGDPVKFTMLNTGKLTDLRATLDSEASESLVNTLSACLQANSVGGRTAGRFDDDAYGLLHKMSLDVANLRGRIESLIKEADPKGVGVTVSTGTIDADIGSLNEADVEKALRYTIKVFTEADNETLSMNTLSENLEKLTKDTAQKVAAFRDLSAKSNFNLAFQPIVSLNSGKIHHFEVLARFGKDCEKSPFELITFAEDTGLVSNFDLAMCRKALNWVARMNKQGKKYVIAVNLSGQSVGNNAFLSALHDLLNNYAALRPQVMFEITESARIQDLELANNFIQGLRNEGHKVCLDDFGAGSAALKYLHTLVVDVVKIDGQYVQSAMTKDRYRSFLRSMVGLCHDLNIVTIAEMIETEACADMLRDCGVGMGQGYLFGRPSFDITDFKIRGDNMSQIAAAEAWKASKGY